MADSDSGKITVEERYRLLKRELTPLFGSGEATAMARLIFHALKGWDATGLVVHSSDVLSPFILGRISGIEDRLKLGAPLQYILGEARFYGMTLTVDRSTLIPRPETEELVDLIVRDAEGRSDLRVLDVGTGSGAIAIALSRNLLFPQVEALDVSEAALKVARDNAARLHADVKFIHADIFSYVPEPDSFDMIVSNPPYICEKEKSGMEPNVLDYEPHAALFVPDSDPLRFYRRIAETGRDALSDDSRIYFEINPIYAGMLVCMMKDAGYADVFLHEDISHRRRFLSAVWPGKKGGRK